MDQFVIKELRQNGISIRPKAFQLLKESLRNFENVQRVLDVLVKIKNLRVSIIDVQEIEKVMNNVQTLEIDPKEYLLFKNCVGNQVKVQCHEQDKTTILIQRFKKIRSQIFGAQEVSAIIGCHDQLRIVGMIIVELSYFYLQDLNSRIKIDINNVEVDGLGYILQQIVIIADGKWNERSGLFEVHKISLPPIQYNDEPVQYEPNLSIKLTNKQRMFYVVSDFNLNDHLVLNKLSTILNKIKEDQSHEAIIGILIMGKLLDSHISQEQLQLQLHNWHQFLDKNEAVLTKTNQFFMPELHDFFIPLFPKPKLPQYFMDLASSKKVNVQSITNPAILIIRGVQITFFRADLGMNYRKSQLLLNPNDDQTDMIQKNIEATIRAQKHLFNGKTIYINHDESLSLVTKNIFIADNSVPSFRHDNFTQLSSFKRGDFAYLEFNEEQEGVTVEIFNI